MQFITFLLGNIKYAIPVVQVVNIEMRSDITRIPCQNERVTGIKKFQGQTIPIYSIAKKMGIADSHPQNLIVVRSQGMVVGVEVDQVLDLGDSGSHELHEMPDMIRNTQSYMSDVAHKDGEITVVVDMEKLIDEEEREAMKNLVSTKDE